MVDKRKPITAVDSARFGVKAGSLLLGITLLASCSMFGEESSVEAEATQATDSVESRVDPDALGVVDGLPPDTANQRYDENVSRRPVTTVRPLQDEPVSAEAPSPEPRASVQPSSVERAPVEPVQASADKVAPTPVPSSQTVAASTSKPAAGPETEAAPSEPRSSKMLVSRGDSTQAAQSAAPAAPAQPGLVADTSALDQAVARAYGGVVERAQVAAARHPEALIPGAVVGGPRGGAVAAGGPVVIGGPAASAMTPTVSGGGYGDGPVVIGGPRGGVASAVSRAPAVAGGHSGGGEPVAVIQFDFGSSALDSHDRRVLRQVADIHARRGGFIRVVGHSSQFTENMPQDKHMLVNFTTSVARAEAVARALRQEGVPPEVIEVSAVGDREPLYLEVMPSGEAGNRRVEIFLVR